MMLKKWPDGQAIAYFQAYTNTYATIDTLENLYRPFADNPDVRELAIATRADCLDDTKIEYLAALNRQKPLTIELGLQSIHDETMRLMNRGHDHACLEKTVRQLHKHGLRICLHLINGLPGETDDMMLETAQAVARLKPEGVKIHMLHVLADAPLGKLYRESPFPLLTRADYVRIVINQLTCLPPETVIERLTGDGMADKLIAPLWTADKITVLNTIAKQMVQTDTFQGKNYAAAKHP
ncbi:hypothetical protein SDC9_89093 [bioreactor metagenome]|uniref:Radical SAM core domain-containing protein n=1 Tax=bioreactor metagenome TaxID=1076179 RepID=A0A644ZPW7_9ZZZZ